MFDNQMEAMGMGQSTISVQLDDTIKKQFDSLCAEFGMSASTAFNIYARTVVRQRKIPFEITAENDPFYDSADGKVPREECCKNTGRSGGICRWLIFRFQSGHGRIFNTGWGRIKKQLSVL